MLNSDSEEVSANRSGGESSEVQDYNTPVIACEGKKGDFLPWSSQAGMSSSAAERRIKELEAELEQTKKDKKPLAVTSYDFKLALNIKERKLHQEDLKILALVYDSNKMKKEQKDK